MVLHSDVCVSNMNCWLFENLALRFCDCFAYLLSREREQCVHLQRGCLGCNGGCWGSGRAGCCSEEESDDGACEHTNQDRHLMAVIEQPA